MHAREREASRVRVCVCARARSYSRLTHPNKHTQQRQQTDHTSLLTDTIGSDCWRSGRAVTTQPATFEDTQHKHTTNQSHPTMTHTPADCHVSDQLQSYYTDPLPMTTQLIDHVTAGGGRVAAGVHEASHGNTTGTNTTEVNKINAGRAEPRRTRTTGGKQRRRTTAATKHNIWSTLQKTGS